MSDSGAVARRYHESTKHSPHSVATGRRGLDGENQPVPFKVYQTLEPIPLPLEIAPTSLPAIQALLGRAPSPDSRRRVPDLATTARLCILSNGVTRIRRYSGGELAFRAAGTTGALYHLELYVACTDLPDLAAGLYHFGAHDNSLYRLRSGDHRGRLIEATGGDPTMMRAPLVIIATSTFWRNAWKYEARAWRHAFWDGGTVLANLLALARASGVAAHIVLAFADREVEAVLDVDPSREGVVAMVALGDTDAPPPPALDAPPLHLPTIQLSPHEIRYPLIEAAHAATSLASPQDATDWRRRAQDLPAASMPRVAGSVERLAPLPPDALPAAPIEQVIRRRGSARRFARRSISGEALATLLDVGRGPLPADFVPRRAQLSGPFLIVNAVDGVEPGAYLVRDEGPDLERLSSGSFRSEAGGLALGQELAAGASVNLYWLADLDRLLTSLGGRGYRAAQLDAAIRAGRTWLAAYALGLGATGLTFFDDEVIRFFGPRAAGLEVMFLLAVGVRESTSA